MLVHAELVNTRGVPGWRPGCRKSSESATSGWPAQVAGRGHPHGGVRRAWCRPGSRRLPAVAAARSDDTDAGEVADRRRRVEARASASRRSRARGPARSSGTMSREPGDQRQLAALEPLQRRCASRSCPWVRVSCGSRSDLERLARATRGCRRRRGRGTSGRCRRRRAGRRRSRRTARGRAASGRRGCPASRARPARRTRPRRANCSKRPDPGPRSARAGRVLHLAEVDQVGVVVDDHRRDARTACTAAGCRR